MWNQRIKIKRLPLIIPKKTNKVKIFMLVNNQLDNIRPVNYGEIDEPLEKNVQKKTTCNCK